MKAIDILEKEEPHIPPALIVTGEDATLRFLVTKKILETKDVAKEDIERLDTKSLPELATLISQGSLFGSRTIVADYHGKWGKTDILATALIEARQAEDLVIIRADEKPQSPATSHLLTEIECEKPSHKKSRAKLVKVIGQAYKIEFTEDAQKLLTERAEQTSDIESAMQILQLAFPKNHKMTPVDVERAIAEPAARRDIMRALLSGNLSRLRKEMNTGDPMGFLALFHASLLRLYTWTRMVKDEKKDEDEAVELLKIPPRFVKEWRAAKYASKALRETMEAVADAFLMEVTGRGDEWRETLLLKMQRLS